MKKETFKMAALLGLYSLFSHKAVAQWTLSTNNLYPTSTSYSVALGGTTPSEMLDVLSGHININNAANAYKINTYPILWHKGNVSSLFCGKDAGFTHTNNVPGYNTFIGNSAGYTTNPNPAASLQGYYNTFIGNQSGYSNVNNCNNAHGVYALFSNTSGNGNVAMGVSAAYTGTTASRNIAIGDSALLLNITGNFNTAVGYKSLYSNTASDNNALGYFSFNSNTSGTRNAGFGTNAGKWNQTGSDNAIFGYNAGGANAGSANSFSDNCFFGSQAGYNMKLQSDNVAIGYQALFTQNYGTAFSSYNVAVGNLALKSTNPTATSNGHRNTAVGQQAGRDNTIGYGNTFLGFDAGMQGTTNHFATYVGYQAGYINSADDVVCVGYQAGYNNSGSDNVLVGINAGINNTGTQNVFLGNYAGAAISGSYNTCTFVGYGADANATGYSNASAIGNGAITTGSNDITLGNTAITSIHSNVTTITAISDGRFKTDVTENVKGLDFIKKLRPVTYKLNTEALDNFIIQNMSDSAKAVHRQNMDFGPSMTIIHAGFIAQEVEQAAQDAGFNSSIVHHPSSSTDPYGIGYAEIVVPLVKAVQELSNSNDKKDSIINRQDSINQALQNQIDYIVTNCCNSGNRIGNNSGFKSDSEDLGLNNDNKNNNSVDVELSDVNAIVLNQNVPNPFAEQTMITYNIPKISTYAQILFYDNSGKLIKTVDIKNTGKGHLNVFANDLSNGTYSYTLVIDGKIYDTKKMVKQ